MVKNREIYRPNSWANFNNLTCVFTTKSIGDMRDEKNKKKLAELIQINKENFVKTNQIHGNVVRIVAGKDTNTVSDDSDGLVTREKGIYLMVLVADCLPIVAFDPQKRIVGIAHAGWRGTVANIAEKLVLKFKDLGSQPKNILFGFGPGIDFCHYEVGGEVADKFRKNSMEKSVLKSGSGKNFVSLKQANWSQLVKAGVPKANIDMTFKSCTYENPDFYSFRKDKTDKRFAAIIGLKDGR